MPVCLHWLNWIHASSCAFKMYLSFQIGYICTRIAQAVIAAPHMLSHESSPNQLLALIIGR